MYSNEGFLKSNLDFFLDCTTPTVPSQFLSKSEIRNLNKVWHPWEREKVEYFTLADLWACYDEWSVYGAGVPITLDDGETLVQYYVPYLSAIQIFTGAKSSTDALREDNYSFCETRDSFSDSLSDESENDKLSKCDGCSSEDGASEQDSFWHMSDRLGYLYCQYFESSTPYGRVPLVDKIRFETLVVTDMDLEDDKVSAERKKQSQEEGMSLSPFGLATYKMQGTMWISGNSGRDQERLVSLLSIADSWLKQLRTQHHDFDYFMGTRRATPAS
ncbi:hypothetical protein U1Q18_024607 [Sarracenia purpurea var. burkii]